MLHSDKCGPKEFFKMEEAHRRGNKKAQIKDFMLKNEGGPGARSSEKKCS